VRLRLSSTRRAPASGDEPARPAPELRAPGTRGGRASRDGRRSGRRRIRTLAAVLRRHPTRRGASREAAWRRRSPPSRPGFRAVVSRHA
jgi:hypothetical protein